MNFNANFNGWLASILGFVALSIALWFMARAQVRSEQAKRDQIVRSLKILLTEPFYRLRSARAEDNEDSELESERAKAA